MKTDVFGARSSFDTGFGRATIYRLDALEKAGVAPGLVRLPFSIKVLLEAVLRSVDDELVTAADVRNLAAWNATAPLDVELPFMPARVILQDFTGVPAVVDLASMRAAVKRLGGDPKRINPLVPVDLVVDHSVQVDVFGTRDALATERRDRVRAQPRALRVPALGTAGVPELPRGAARDRHRAPGEPRVPGEGRAAQGRGRRVGRDARHARRHRLAHHDDQRSRRAGLGRRRDRGRGGDARPAALHGDAAGRRLPARRAGCARASPRPTWCSRSPRCCARRASSRSSSSSTGPGSPR